MCYLLGIFGKNSNSLRSPWINGIMHAKPVRLQYKRDTIPITTAITIIIAILTHFARYKTNNMLKSDQYFGLY